ncbi:MAG TPA: glycosyltransferase family 39 protein, partial [Gaiellaceae bacterium]|nr:glycosyltransferase family 39 protein [Gaiellaceae bacterium]
MSWRLRAEQLLGRATDFLEGRPGPFVVLAVALVVWWVQALVIPLAPGRDFGTYAGAWVELFQRHPVDLGYVLGRTPLAPIVVGALLDPLDGRLAEAGVSLLYAGSVLAWFLAARRFGGGAALATMVVLLLYPSYGILFHQLASDAVFAAAFAAWSYLTVCVVLRPSTLRFALVGLGIGLLVLVRPGNQALVVLALVPLLLVLPWRARIAGSLALLASAVAVLGIWTVHNGARFGDYTVARGGNSRLPFERVYLTDRIVRPGNGPASRRLADAAERELLTVEPYRSYGIRLDDLFDDPSPRMKDDLGWLANELDGWSSDERLLRQVGIEAVRTHPGVYARGVAKTVLKQLHGPVFRPLSSSTDTSASAQAVTSPAEDDVGADTVVVDGRRLPRPSEGERIPAPHQGGPTSPDGSIYTVWTSPTEHHLVFVHPGDRARLEALHRRIGELEGSFPDRVGSDTLALRFNQLSRWFPPPLLWIVVALAALAIRRPGHVVALATPALAAFIVVVLNALAIAGVPRPPDEAVRLPAPARHRVHGSCARR